MKALLVVVTTLLVASITAQASPVGAWMRNYNHLVTLLERTTMVGSCNISLSKDPYSPPGAWDVNFVKNHNGLLIFQIVPPDVTNGMTQAEYLSRDVLRYRQSDPVGWVNMKLKLDQYNDRIVGIELTKTLPDGTVYNTGLVCKTGN